MACKGLNQQPPHLFEYVARVKKQDMHNKIWFESLHLKIKVQTEADP
jgi:hypothetical protein